MQHGCVHANRGTCLRAPGLSKHALTLLLLDLIHGNVEPRGIGNLLIRPVSKDSVSVIPCFLKDSQILEIRRHGLTCVRY